MLFIKLYLRIYTKIKRLLNFPATFFIYFIYSYFIYSYFSFKQKTFYILLSGKKLFIYYSRSKKLLYFTLQNNLYIYYSPSENFLRPIFDFASSRACCSSSDKITKASPFTTSLAYVKQPSLELCIEFIIKPLSSSVSKTSTKLSFPPISLNASYFTSPIF